MYKKMNFDYMYLFFSLCLQFCTGQPGQFPPHLSLRLKTLQMWRAM